MSEPAPSVPGGRLVSLDALRGFDMFWILGMEEVGVAVAKASSAGWAQWTGTQLDHAAWAGFHFLDLIFPLFVFISGVSLVFSMDKAVERHGRAAAWRKLLLRTLVLYLLGIFQYGLLSKGIENIRWLGVLQRIALCGFAAGTAWLWLGQKSRIALTVSLLAGYWALMTFVPVPGGSAGNFDEGANLSNWIDSQWLPGYKWDGNHDPEGLLSTLPAIASALLGLFAGEFLKYNKRPVLAKAGQLALAGVILAAVGWAWHMQFPVIKKLWTSSFVLVAGGYSLLLLAGFVALVDGLGVRRPFLPWIWIGMNPITLYLTHGFIHYEKLSERLLGGPLTAWTGAWQEVIFAFGVVALSTLLAWFLYSRRIFLRV